MRSVFCGCGWKGRRLAHANDAPCPRCGSTDVYVSSRSAGRPRREGWIRTRVEMPERWLELLGDPVAPQIREAVRAELERRGFEADER